MAFLQNYVGGLIETLQNSDNVAPIVSYDTNDTCV